MSELRELVEMLISGGQGTSEYDYFLAASYTAEKIHVEREKIKMKVE